MGVVAQLGIAPAQHFKQSVKFVNGNDLAQLIGGMAGILIQRTLKTRSSRDSRGDALYPLVASKILLVMDVLR